MRRQKIMRIGDSYAVVIPKYLVTEEMLEKGVYLDVLHYDKHAMLIRLVTANDGKHHKNHEKSREDT